MQFIFQKKSLILSIIFLLFSCFVFLFLIKMINDNRETSKLAEEKWQGEFEQRGNIKSLADSIKETSSEVALLESHFVRSSDVVPFLNTIEKLAKEAKVQAEVSSVNVAADNSSLLIDINSSGSFGAVYKFILLLENSPYDLQFVSASIQNPNKEHLPVDKDNKVPEWTASFQIKLLSFISQ